MLYLDLSQILILLGFRKDRNKFRRICHKVLTEAHNYMKDFIHYKKAYTETKYQAQTLSNKHDPFNIHPKF